MRDKYQILLDNKNNSISFLYKEENISVKVTYRKRKNISIRIIPKSTIEIISPRSVPISFLKKVLDEKASWIMKTLDKFENIDESFKNRKYINGEIFYYLGKEYELKIIEDKNINNKNNNYCYIDIKKENLIITTNNNEAEYIKNELKKWYKIESEKIVIQRLEVLKKENSIMNQLTPNIIKIKEQKRRWGSCTSNKDIYINSRISMARIDVIDYILVHEFSHLVHMNHSKEFYNFVGSILPEFRECEKWLKENSYKLSL